MTNAVAQGQQVPDDLLGELVDSSSILDQSSQVRVRLADDG